MSIGLWLLSPLGALLELCVVIAILRRRYYRRFPIVLALSLFGVVWLIVLSVAVNPRHLALSSRTYAVLYWMGDLVTHGLILSLVLTLIGQAIEGTRSAGRTMLLLAGAVIVFGFGSLAVLRSQPAWETALSRNMSFCEEVLNFILWIALIRSRRRDGLLFMVSAGIGLQVTGEVIGHTIRMYTGFSRFIVLPDILVVVSEILCLVIWIYAFWTAPPAGSEQVSQA
jgi:hypothetical protein